MALLWLSFLFSGGKYAFIIVWTPITRDDHMKLDEALVGFVEPSRWCPNQTSSPVSGSKKAQTFSSHEFILENDCSLYNT